MNILAQTLHGSRMYGLDNPMSDYDEKAIHLPSVDDCLLLCAPQNVNTKDTVNGVKLERESFALQSFLKLAARGEDVAICMMHCPDSAIIQTSPLFDYLRANRTRFYTKHMSGQLGYAKSQSAKYALRADRMETVEQVIHYLEIMQARGVARLSQAWDDLPRHLPYTRVFENPSDRGADKRVFEVVGKGLPATISPNYALDIMINVRDSYGERVRAARSMDNTDLKALSHSFRVGYQLLHLFVDGTFSFPLPETDFIKAVKEGRLNYVDDKLDERLNDLITKVETLSDASQFADSVDVAWLDDIVLDTYARAVHSDLVVKTKTL